MRITADDWDMHHLRTHLQAAAELEAWTIPYYVSAMSSIVEQHSEAYLLIKSVANQEMLHLQLVSNIANAYGYSPRIDPSIFAYQGTTVPHLDFSLDPGNPTEQFSPYSAEIGPLDEQRINAMCLIEYPEWDTGGVPDLRDKVSEYGSIGEFYDALQHGAELLQFHVKGGVNQDFWFSEFYPDLPDMRVMADGADGFDTVKVLMEVIRDQGEAAQFDEEIDERYRSVKDDPRPAASHYQKFFAIRESIRTGGQLDTYAAKDPQTYTPEDEAYLKVLLDDFALFTGQISDLLAGRKTDLSLMGKVGEDILACWKNGVTPRFQ